MYYGAIYGAQEEILVKTSVGFFVLLASGIFASLLSSSHLRDRSLPVPDVSQELVLTVGKGPAPVAIADVNRDGYLDILVANADDRTLAVLLGDGRGHFHGAPGPPISTGEGPNDIAIGDFNGDSNLDLVI